jgi:PIN domain nuclease of toxin-antitoxin system
VILLDTHALVWVLEDSPELGRRAAAIANRALKHDGLWVSAVAFWELSLLVDRKRIRLSGSPEEFRSRVQGLGIQEAPLTGDVALAAARLGASLKDPADCFIAATALLHHGKLMTADDRLLDAGVVDVLDARR